MFRFKFGFGFFVLVLGSAFAVPAAGLRAQADPIARIGIYVEQYYSRAQSIVAEEMVEVQPLSRDLAPEGFPRRVVNELRVEWDPAAADPDERATVVRERLKATGPPIFPPGQEHCADPPSFSPEPLAFLLPTNQPEWEFVIGKPARVDGRTLMTVNYKRQGEHPARVHEDNDCLFTDLSGRTKGRLWLDPETDEIVRMDEELMGMVDIRVPREFWGPDRPSAVTYERMMTSVRYKRVTFTDPDEALLLPSSIQTVQVHSGIDSRRGTQGISRLRITQTFTKYRRFVTGSRILP